MINNNSSFKNNEIPKISKSRTLKSKNYFNKLLINTLIDNIPDAIYFKDRESRFLLINKACSNKFSLKNPENAIGKTDFDYFSEEHATQAFNDEQEIIRTGKPIISLEEKETWPKNKVMWASTTKMPLLNEEGRVIGTFGVTRDITDKKEAEEELIKLNDFNMNLLANSPNPIAVSNADGSIKYLNPAFEKMTGYLLTEVEGIKPPYPWWLKESQAETLKFFKKVIDGAERRSEIRYQAKDGRKLWILVDVSIQKAEGEIKYIITNFIDITDKKNAQDKLEYLSFHDSLTGLYNRAFFDEEIKRLGRSRKIPISIIIGDANNLKLSNDIFGHARGDELLKLLARVLQKCCRNEDIISRWGGDEFAIILPDTGLNIADGIIKRIKKACIKECKKEYPVSLALGAAVKETKNDDINIVFKIAEDDMYRNKMMERKILSRSMFSFLESVLFEIGAESEDHVTRLKKYINKFGECLKLTDKQLHELKLLAKYQDIGKVSISEIASKNPEELSEKDKEIMKRHPETGYKIAESFPDISCISDYILTHHENWDGNGYPGKLKELSIPYNSRIISIINAYDEKVNGNFNNIAISKSKVLKDLKKLSGIQFDPDLFKSFIEVM